MNRGTRPAGPIVVTGACGLLGTELCLLLRSHGYAVVGVDDLSRYKLIGEEGTRRLEANAKEIETAGVNFFRMDVRLFVEQRYMPADTAAIVHTAAQVCHSRRVDAPWDNIEVNYLQTNLILNDARARNVSFLFNGSTKVLAHSEWPLNDDSPLGDRTPMTFFGATKMAADVLAQQYGYTYGMTVGVMRPGCFTGARALATEGQNWLPWLVHCNLTGRPFNLFGDGSQVRDVMHVGDLADACLRWIEKPKAGVWAMGARTKNSISVNEAIELVEKLTGKKTKVMAHPSRPGDMQYLVVGGERFSHDYGWQPTKCLDAIVDELVKSLRQGELR